MTYEIEYYAYGEGDRQPAEQFEDELERSARKLLGKLQGVTLRVAQELPRSSAGDCGRSAAATPTCGRSAPFSPSSSPGTSPLSTVSTTRRAWCCLPG